MTRSRETFVLAVGRHDHVVRLEPGLLRRLAVVGADDLAGA